MKEIQACIEAMLFASGDAVGIERLAQALEVSSEDVQQQADALANFYDFEQRGLMLVRLEDKLQLVSRPQYGTQVRRIMETRKPTLSAAALEVLAIAAYRQPVTRALIDQVRGVDSAGTVSSLVDKGLLEEAGRLDVPGRPIQYRTTDAFLRAFALQSLCELPPLPALQPPPDTPLDENIAYEQAVSLLPQQEENTRQEHSAINPSDHAPHTE